MMGLFSNFFGGDSRRDIRRGQQEANRLLNRGRDMAAPLIEGGYNEAIEGLQPFVEGGAAGQSMYDDLIGINGPEAQARAQQMVMSDPANMGALGQEQNAMLRAMNAQGRSASGAGALAAERVFQQNYGNILNRYGQRGQQGQQAAGLSGQFAVGRGSDLGNLQFGVNQMKANNQINASNAIAGTRNTGMNNLLNIAGTAARFVSPM